ncbi:hypothetical protein L7F22_055523 [Adiantum nelumboides]|nr:hypothetical protein [Adiantum nelumboides]
MVFFPMVVVLAVAGLDAGMVKVNGEEELEAVEEDTCFALHSGSNSSNLTGFSFLVECRRPFREMRNINLGDGSTQLDTLSEDERRALRGSKFAPLSTHASNRVVFEPRKPHPGGAVATNKAAALAKFLQRKLEASPGSLSLDPLLVEAAVENAKANLRGLSSSAVKVRHVETFSDNEKEADEERAADTKALQPKCNKKKRKNKKKWKQATKAENATGKVTLKKQKQK